MTSFTMTLNLRERPEAIFCNGIKYAPINFGAHSANDNDVNLILPFDPQMIHCNSINFYPLLENKVHFHVNVEAELMLHQLQMQQKQQRYQQERILAMHHQRKLQRHIQRTTKANEQHREKMEEQNVAMIAQQHSEEKEVTIVSDDITNVVEVNASYVGTNVPQEAHVQCDEIEKTTEQPQSQQKQKAFKGPREKKQFYVIPKKRQENGPSEERKAVFRSADGGVLGKLFPYAKDIFCKAYGIGTPRHDHKQLIKEAISQTGCSENAVLSLLYM